MGSVYRFKASLTGFTGGPGLNTWHMCNAGEASNAANLDDMAASIKDVYNALKTVIVASCNVAVQPICEEFDIASGDLLGVFPCDAGGSVQGTSTGQTLSRATQITVQLRTDAIRANRQVAGRHFIGPIGTTQFDATGAVGASSRTTVQQAYNGVLDLLGGGRLVVWAKPNLNHTRPDARAGRIGYVQSVLANSVPGTLRSRKV